jgi:hypothetical protein
MAERGEGATGTPNTIYDLASVLYHTLDAGSSYDQYVRDAEEAGDQELAEFFRVLRDEDARRADYAQELLARRTPTGGARTEAVARPREGTTAGIPPSSPVPPQGQGTSHRQGHKKRCHRRGRGQKALYCRQGAKRPRRGGSKRGQPGSRRGSVRKTRDSSMKSRTGSWVPRRSAEANAPIGQSEGD